MTMKPLGALLLFGLLGFGAYHAILAPPSVAAATQSLTTVQADLKTAATTTNAVASQVTQALDDPNRSRALPAELQAFTRSADHLAALRSTLIEDLAAYQAAANAKLATFDQERNKVSDEHTSRSLLALRRHVQTDMSERLEHAQATLDGLDAVLAKGSDLQHAAKCVLIADDLHTEGEDLDRQLVQAKQDATQYAATTNNLLARITTALGEE